MFLYYFFFTLCNSYVLLVICIAIITQVYISMMVARSISKGHSAIF